MEISCHDQCPQSARIATSASRPVNNINWPCFGMATQLFLLLGFCWNVYSLGYLSYINVRYVNFCVGRFFSAGLGHLQTQVSGRITCAVMQCHDKRFYAWPAKPTTDTPVLHMREQAIPSDSTMKQWTSDTLCSICTLHRDTPITMHIWWCCWACWKMPKQSGSNLVSN